MPQTQYRGRRAFSIENPHLRITVLEEGGHVAEFLHKASGVNPLWTPPWPSIEPSTYDPRRHPEYGADAESKLLAGIAGHNLCLDIFGGPSETEAAAGLTVHGEASVARYDVVCGDSDLIQRADFPQSQLRFERRMRLLPAAPVVEFVETLENLTATDRPVAWTQHVTLGPPFLEKGRTQFRASATRSKVFEGDFGKAGYLLTAAEFEWPNAPLPNGRCGDLRLFTDLPVSCAFTTHLMDPSRDTAFFTAFSPTHQVAFGYVWTQADFPWLGIWEENYSRANPPWNGQTLTCGMEFGASPMPESRRQMIARGGMFGAPGFRWIPARQRVQVEYRAAIAHRESSPEELSWSSTGEVRFE